MVSMAARKDTCAQRPDRTVRRGGDIRWRPVTASGANASMRGRGAMVAGARAHAVPGRGGIQDSARSNPVQWRLDSHQHMALSAGIRLGPYEIVAPLGAGGMGRWIAHMTLHLVVTLPSRYCRRRPKITA